MTTTEPQMTDHTIASARLAPHETRAESASEDRKLRAAALARVGPQLLETLDRERADAGYEPADGPTGERPDPVATGPSPSPLLTAPVVDEASPFFDDTVPDDEEGPDDHPVVDPEHPSAADSAFGRRARALDREPSLSLVMESAPAAGSTPLTPPRVAHTDIDPQPPEALALTIPDMLRELAGLRDDGILTGAEFEAKKKDLLARI